MFTILTHLPLGLVVDLLGQRIPVGLRTEETVHNDDGRLFPRLVHLVLVRNVRKAHRALPERFPTNKNSSNVHLLTSALYPITDEDLPKTREFRKLITIYHLKLIILFTFEFLASTNSLFVSRDFGRRYNSSRFSTKSSCSNASSPQKI